MSSHVNIYTHYATVCVYMPYLLCASATVYIGVESCLVCVCFSANRTQLFMAPFKDKTAVYLVCFQVVEY